MVLNFLKSDVSIVHERRYVRVAKYWTPLKAAQAKKTAIQTAAKDLFFQTISGIMHVFCNFSCRPSQSRKAGNKTTAIVVKTMGTGFTNNFGASATILLLGSDEVELRQNIEE
jgi:hypothetical protein